MPNINENLTLWFAGVVALGVVIGSVAFQVRTWLHKHQRRER